MYMLIFKTTAVYVHAHEQLRLCFYVLVCYFVVFDTHLRKIKIIVNNCSLQAQ